MRIASLHATSRAPAPVAWRLLARPDQWHRWAPHVRGALGLGRPEVRAGARGIVRLAGIVPVPAHILQVTPGRAWEWQVGPVRMRHLVRERAEGCEVAIELAGREPVRSAVQLVYGPVIALLLGNLARVAEQDADRAAAAGW